MRNAMAAAAVKKIYMVILVYLDSFSLYSVQGRVVDIRLQQFLHELK
jgi:hypothetical protein